MESVDRKVSGQDTALIVTCKNFDCFQLIFSSLEDAQKVQASVEPLSVVGKLIVMDRGNMARREGRMTMLEFINVLKIYKICGTQIIIEKLSIPL